MAKNKKIIFFLILLGIFAIGSTVLAQAKKCGEINWPKSPAGTDINSTWSEAEKKCIYPNLTIMVKYFYEWGITLGGLATFIALVFAGFQYLTSVGRPEIMREAIDRIRSAIFGLVLLLSSWLILNTINPELTTFRPVSLGPISGFTACDCRQDTECRDCQPPAHPNPEEYKKYQCFGDPIPGDGKKEGICVLKMQTTREKPCDYAELFSETGWRNSLGTINPDQTLTKSPKSVKSFYRENGTGKPCNEKPGDPACGCILQLFSAKQVWWWTECGDKIGDILAYEADITRWTDRPVYCVRLIAPK